MTYFIYLNPQYVEVRSSETVLKKVVCRLKRRASTIRGTYYVGGAYLGTVSRRACKEMFNIDPPRLGSYVMVPDIIVNKVYRRYHGRRR